MLGNITLINYQIVTAATPQPPESDFRITDNLNQRITDDGNLRITD